MSPKTFFCLLLSAWLHAALSVAAGVIEPRLIIFRPPTYLALSDGVYADYTLLKLEKGKNVLVTAGPASPYNSSHLPPSPILQGEFRQVDDNKFVPDNRGWRRPFDYWTIGIVVVGDQCLKATLSRPYLTLAPCQKGTLSDTSLTWINWGPYVNRGIGAYLEPYGNQSAETFIRDQYPSALNSWGLEENQHWRSYNKLVPMSKSEGSHLTIVKYDIHGPVANQTVGF